MKSKILRIIDLAIEISESTNTDVMVDYSGHVKSVSVRIHENGWLDGVEPSKDWHLYLDFESDAPFLDEITEYLEALLLPDYNYTSTIDSKDDIISDLKYDIEQLKEEIETLEIEISELKADEV